MNSDMNIEIDNEINNEARHERTKKLIGESALNKLKNSKIAIFGIGGVGSYVCEALARAGIGEMTLIDGDVVELSNINRQLVALTSTLGKNKAVVMGDRIRDINPKIKVEIVDRFYKTGDEFDFKRYDYVVDAIDDIPSKVDIIKSCHYNGVKVISAMGTGNKLSCDNFKVSDLSKTHMDPLARVMRKKLKDEQIDDLKVVFSDEKPSIISSPPGTISYVPGTEGLMIAGFVIRELTEI